MSSLLLHPPRTVRRGRSTAVPSSLIAADARSVARAAARSPIALFQKAAVRVPAYRDFLRGHRISPRSIRTVDDFREVPPVDKDGYLRKYPLESLCWDGTLRGKKLIFTATSGSTGQPFYFPRDYALDVRSSLMHELFLHAASAGKQKSTLVIVTFGMGVWIGGLITYQAFRLLAERGYPVSIITPGTNKAEIFEALARLAPKFEQVVVCGYPPFIKDVLDEAPEHGFDPAKRPLKLLFAAESFSEAFRSYVADRAGIADALADTASIYGSADLGTMAIETPSAIALRRAALADQALYARLFPDVTRLPTLAQFHPSLANFEAQDGELLVTGDSALPLVRYAIGDRGGVIPYGDMAEAVKENAPGDAGKYPAGDAIKAALPMPFVYVYERADFSVKLYGAIVYAEHVRAALSAMSLASAVTGKFSMAAARDESENAYLELDVELKNGADGDGGFSGKVAEEVSAGLIRMSAELRNSAEALGGRIPLRVVCWPYGHPDRFRPGDKQKWVRNSCMN